MNKEELEQQIIAAIKSGKNKFHMIYGACDTRFQRTVDKRLQSLRKRGLIQFNSRTGWTMVETANG